MNTEQACNSEGSASQKTRNFTSHGIEDLIYVKWRAYNRAKVRREKVYPIHPGNRHIFKVYKQGLSLI